MKPGELHMTGTHTPIRQCVGCRGKAPQTELLRIAAQGGELLLDPRRRLPGRGAYVHHRRECLDRATRRGSLARALRTSVQARAVTELQRSVASMLGAAAVPEAEMEARTAASAAGRRSPESLEKPPIHGLTQPGPRFVVGTLHSKEQ
jgi:predicted RNA-binding protein YlxR (DUF448 family)